MTRNNLQVPPYESSIFAKQEGVAVPTKEQCDALANALAAAIPALHYNRTICDSAEKIYKDALAALISYRGKA